MEQERNPPEPIREQPPRRTVLIAGLASGAVLGAGALAAAPRPGRLGDPTGDADLAAALAPHLTGHRRVAAVLREEDGTLRGAGFGATGATEFEPGSITKTFTAALLMEGVARGEIALTSTVADVLGEDAAGSPIADVRMEELAAHISGLPGTPASLALTSLPARLLRHDPYAARTPQHVITDALAAPAGARGQELYSNLGISLLGHLVARSAGSTWKDLLMDRLIGPMRLAATSAPLTADALPAGAPRGRTEKGQRAGPWTGNGYAPCGGLRSSADDLAVWLGTMIDGSNPGAQGLDPISPPDPSDGSATAVVWVRTPAADASADVIWHNGMTGGFAAFCGWREDTGRGIVLLSDTARFVDDLAMGILEGRIAA